MPSVASDPSSIFPPPPPRGQPSNRVANDDAAADMPFAQMVERTAAPEREPAPRSDSAPRARRSKDADVPSKAAKGDKTDKPAKSDTATKDTAATDKTADAAATDDPAAVACAAPQAKPAAPNTDDVVADFEAAVAAAQGQSTPDATDADTTAKSDESKADATDSKDATNTPAVDAKTPDTTTTDVKAEQPKAADAVAVAIATIAEQPAVAAPKTSVPQIPRANAPGQAKHAAKAQPQEQAETTAKAGADETSGDETVKVQKTADQTDDASVPAHVVRRAERFSAMLDADNKQPRADAPQAAKPADAAMPTLPQVQAAQAPAAAAPISAANAALAAKPVPLDGVAVEIAARATEGKSHFEIRLDPPELGRIEVRLDVDKNGQVVSHITADRGDTLDLLRRDASNLERALQDAGLKTGGNNLQFSLRDQGFAQGRQDAGTETARLVVEDTSTPAPIPRDYRAFGARSGGVDIRV